MPELFIDGRWVSAANGGSRTIVCPATGEIVADVDEASDVDTIAAIARWPCSPN